MSRSLPTVAKILLDLALDRPFDYSVPPELADRLRVGMLVSVPFGRGKGEREGCVVALTDRSDYPVSDLKPILAIRNERPSLPDALLKLADWMAEYYCCTREQALRNLMPGAVRSGKIKPKKELRFYLADAAEAAKYIAGAKKQQEKRAAMLKQLSVRPGSTADQLIRATGLGKSVLDALVKAGLVKKEAEQIDRDPFKGMKVMKTEPLTPTPEQKVALDKIFDMADHPGGKHVLLLHGITCSGKTEVYLQAIGHILKQGGDAIVLVPEISLTPQTVNRFRSRFGDMVSVLHSGLTDGERFDEWMKVRNGKVRIAVGARSALFAPFANLKLIVVDEEHESSYKQSEAPRYNARDVAVMRGKLEGALVILGSATPSMESYRNAETGKYELVEMLKRSDPSIVLPSVRIIDMKLEANEEGKSPYFSKILIDAVYDRIRNGEQTILFLNKRGYARQMMCEACGYVAMCPDCSVAYTYHKHTETLSCHLCASTILAPEICPVCGSQEIRYSGAGTERIENVCRELFQGARIARMDSDTMTRPSLYEKVLTSFRRGDIDILIGTQMIAKGLDFPNVTLVGIVNPDLGLMMSDFRAVERSFQLLAQVAGRAGRGFIPGEVIIQTRLPYNPAIQFAAEHDYKGFYKEEIQIRQEFNYPPFTHLAVLHFDGMDGAATLSAAMNFTEAIGSEFDPKAVSISEPCPAPLERIKGKYRFVCVVHGEKLGIFRRRLRAVIMEWRRQHKDIEFYADIDALNLI